MKSKTTKLRNPEARWCVKTPTGWHRIKGGNRPRLAHTDFITVCGCEVSVKLGRADKSKIDYVPPTCETCLTTHIGGKKTCPLFATFCAEVEKTLRDAVENGNPDFYPALVKLRHWYEREAPKVNLSTYSKRWGDAVRIAVERMGGRRDDAEEILHRCRVLVGKQKSKSGLHTVSNG